MGHRLCIFGGSGFVGRAIVRYAVEQGYDVTVACRHPERARSLMVEGVHLIKADIVEGRGVNEAVQHADAVINLVGLLFEKGRYTFDAAHVHGTEHVLDACKSHGIQRYLHMSALGAGCVPESAYARTKAEAEHRVEESPLQWTIFRPSIIYGDHDSFFNKFKAMGALMPVMPVIAGQTRFQPVWVEDVARAFVAAIHDKRTFGRTYILAGPKIYTFRELLEILNRELGRQRILLPMPLFAAKLLARFTEWLPTPLLTRDQLLLLQHDNIAEGDAFPSVFGEAAALERVLPTYIHGSQPEHIQRQLDAARQRYRKGSI